MNWIIRLWRAHQRWTDIHILWPACLDGAHGQRHIAAQAFRVHMEMDIAYRGMDEIAKQKFLEELP
jgi:head-tail adaptor